MANKKLIFITSNPSQFKGFFRNKLLLIGDKIDIYLLIYPYGLNNKNLRYELKEWTNNLKTKLIIKKVWYLENYSYTNIKESINFNIRLIKIFKRINQINCDFFFISTQGHYWEKLLVNFFKKKKIIGYLLSPPSGMDLFNSYKDFIKSINYKKFFFDDGRYLVESDNESLHQINTNSTSRKRLSIIEFIKDKIKIRINILINYFIVPIYLKLSYLKMNNFEDKINFNFNGTNKIICFHPGLINLLKTMYPGKKIDCLSLLKNNKINVKNKKWVYLSDNNNKKSLQELYKIIFNLKKINKIKKLFIKQHPTWQSEIINDDIIKKLKEIKIPFEILKNTKNTIYEKVEGIILEPGSSIIEGLTHNPNLKIIVIKSNYKVTSGAIYQFYKKFNEICWNYNVKNLKQYLKKKLYLDKNKKFHVNKLNF